VSAKNTQPRASFGLAAVAARNYCKQAGATDARFVAGRERIVAIAGELGLPRQRTRAKE